MPDLEQDIAAAAAAVGKQGDTVRSLKAELKDGKIQKVRRSLADLCFRRYRKY